MSAKTSSALDDDILADLSSSIEGTLLTVDLLGRSQPRRQAEGSLRFQDPAGAVTLEPLAPEEAIDHFRDLVPLTSEQFKEVAERYRRYAFAVGGAADIEITGRIKGLIETALREGMTERAFLAAAGEIMTGATQSYLATVYQTNMSSAYMAGRWKGLQEDPFVRSVLSLYRYVTMGDILVRPTHAALHNFTAPQNDPAWRKIWPPNGYNCRCDVVAVTEEEARRSGWEPSGALPEDGFPDKGFDFNPGIVEEGVREELEAKARP